jgi:hypothetical protein
MRQCSKRIRANRSASTTFRAGKVDRVDQFSIMTVYLFVSSIGEKQST